MITKVGVVGCGYWGKNIIRNLFAAKNCRVIALADNNKTELAELKSQYPSVKTFPSADMLLNLKEIDAVAIATPMTSHYRLVVEALKRRKHVLVEKPLACTISECVNLIEVSRGIKRTLMVDHTFLYTGAVQKIKELIDGGDIGDILYYDSVRVNLGLFQKDRNVIWDLAPHDISIMNFLLGSSAPTVVSARGLDHINRGIEDVAYMNVMFRGKIMANFHFNWLAPVKTRLTLIGGTKKMIVYDDAEPSEKIKVYDKGVKKIKGKKGEKFQPLYDYRTGDMYAPKIDLSEPLRKVCEEFGRCAYTGKKPLSDGVAGLRVVEIISAAEKSIKNNGQNIHVKKTKV